MFFDIEIGVMPAGRVTIELHTTAVPKTSENCKEHTTRSILPELHAHKPAPPAAASLSTER